VEGKARGGLGDWAPTLRGEGTSMLIETTRVGTPSSSSISKINIPTYCHVKNATHGPAPVKKRSETSTVRPWTGQSRGEEVGEESTGGEGNGPPF